MIHKEYSNITEGEFRFDELLKHIDFYKAPKIIAIGEDATRVVCRVQYDPETNRMVGFVLPCNQEGFPLTDSFIAISFPQMEHCFTSADIAKYAVIYMASPLAENIPAFCLACVGTNNKYTFNLVVQRWSYILCECGKRGITVVSFGADGDSRALKTMLQSSNLFFNSSLKDSGALNKISLPDDWSTWFTIKATNTIAYVQDVVHLAVKLKARLLSPSVVLPLGGFLAGVHHLLLVQESYGKDLHGMRLKDLDHKDRQNYDAVLHITSNSVLDLLSEIPEAMGTSLYLKVMRNVMDSYLDKTLDVKIQIKKAWYAVYFMRYWRAWILLNPMYSLGNNFITSNAYKSIELNAHSLIIYMMTLRDHVTSDYYDQLFLLGY